MVKSQKKAYKVFPFLGFMALCFFGNEKYVGVAGNEPGKFGFKILAMRAPIRHNSSNAIADNPG